MTQVEHSHGGTLLNQQHITGGADMSEIDFRRRDGPGESLAPFYAPPPRKTSAQIIKEARAALNLNEPIRVGVGVQRVGVKTVQTKRPFTPRERERTLFGGATNTTAKSSRPPSSFTLSPLHFDTNEVVNGRGSATGARLVPILNRTSSSESSDGEVSDPDPTVEGLLFRYQREGHKLPAICKQRVQRHQFRALSLCDLPEEGEDPEECSARDGGPGAINGSPAGIGGGGTPNASGGLLDRGGKYGIPRKSHSFGSISELQEDVLEKADQEVGEAESQVGASMDSHTSSPSPESRPDDVKKPKHPSGPPAGGPGHLAGSPAFQKDTQDLKKSLLKSKASVKKSKSIESPPASFSMKGSVNSKKTLTKRQGVDRDWRHAVETSPEAAAAEEEKAAAEARRKEEEAEERRKKESKREKAVDQAVYFEEKIAPILDEIKRSITCGVEDSVVAEIVVKLYCALESGGLLGRHLRYRSQVLKTVFRLVDREDGTLLAQIARIMLALKVSGTNLTSVCKLVFKVTRHDTNDSLFLEGNLLDLLLEAVGCINPLEDYEACVYGYGALKFLTMNSQLVNRLLNKGVLELLVLHMKLITSHKEDNGIVPEQTTYALFQLTGTLRNVSSSERTFPLLLVTTAVPQVCSLLHHFAHDQDVTSNVVRILSIISTHEDCCAAITEHDKTFPAAVAALKRYKDSPAIIVRLAYALGNMMAKTDDARWKLFSENGFTETLLEILTLYLRKDREAEGGLRNDDFTSAGLNGTPEDVMVKIIRVIANVSIHPRVGPVLARSRTCTQLLVSVLRHKQVEESEELVLSVLATLNNLTYYTHDIHQAASSLHTELADCLCDMLPMEHVEGLVETIRVFGNLTHFREVRDIFTKREVLEVLIEMLDCDSRELVYVCAGVLVNMMSDASKRSIFQAENGVLRMIDVLQYFGYGDWQLCSLACQVLWNFCASAADVQATLGHKETEKLIYVLEEYLDDDSYFNNPEVFGECDPETRDVVYQLWEDFAQVASKLLDRVEENTTSLPVVSTQS
ncbi:armadillo repeat-containing protein 2 isoform X2 [Oratosquilla oratoria]|uniref:armadillo repeat-containing protein 2 isoform X2 n=1 Tax=Oratosquilla oratoria TaxID=337810 RepID=UPI003F75F7B4